MIRSLVCASVTVVVLSACSPSANLASSSAESHSECEVVVGVVSLTDGVVASMGRSAESGFDEWVAETNESGGAEHHPVSVITRPADTPAEAGKAAQELVDEGVSLVISPVSSDASVAAGKVAVPAGVPTISWGGTSPDIVESVGAGMFSMGHSDRAQAQVLVDYAREQGFTKALTVRGPETRFTDGLPKYFAESFTAAGGTVVGEELFRFGQTDFSDVVARFKASGADVLVTAAYGPELSALLTQVRAAGITTPIIGADGAADPVIAALPAAEGFAYSSYVVADSAKADTVLKAVTKRSGAPAFPMTALLGYEMGLVLDEAIGTADSCSPREIGTALAEVSDVSGVTGTVTFAGGDGMAIRTMNVVQIRDGDPVVAYSKPVTAS